MNIAVAPVAIAEVIVSAPCQSGRFDPDRQTPCLMKVFGGLGGEQVAAIRQVWISHV